MCFDVMYQCSFHLIVLFVWCLYGRGLHVFVCCVTCKLFVFSFMFFFFKQKTAYEMRISDWSSDVCSSDLHEAGWMVDIPKASMYIWAKIPEFYESLGSLEFAKRVLADAKVAVSPGIGFGEYGDGYVRSEEHTSELQSLMRISSAVFCLKKKKIRKKYIAMYKYNKQL